eukprot:scaffold14326_cov214-Alexandrium_tamarense.AAC.4
MDGMQPTSVFANVSSCDELDCPCLYCLRRSNLSGCAATNPIHPQREVTPGRLVEIFDSVY